MRGILFNRFFYIGNSLITLGNSLILAVAFIIAISAIITTIFSEKSTSPPFTFFLKILFPFYIIALLFYVFMPFYKNDGTLITAYKNYNFELLNFGEISFGSIIKNIVYNIGLFFPFGFLMVFVLEKFKYRYFLTILTGALFSIIIELIQLKYAYRVTDIDDFIFNTLGTIIGAITAFIVIKIVKVIRKIELKKSKYS